MCIYTERDRERERLKPVHIPTGFVCCYTCLHSALLPKSMVLGILHEQSVICIQHLLSFVVHAKFKYASLKIKSILKITTCSNIDVSWNCCWIENMSAYLYNNTRKWILKLIFSVHIQQWQYICVNSYHNSEADIPCLKTKMFGTHNYDWSQNLPLPVVLVKGYSMKYLQIYIFFVLEYESIIKKWGGANIVDCRLIFFFLFLFLFRGHICSITQRGWKGHLGD